MDRPLFTLADVMPLPKESRHDTAKERRKRSLSGAKYDLDLLGDCVRSWNNKENFRKERADVIKMIFDNQWGDIIHVHGIGDMTEERWIQMQGMTPLKNNVMHALWMSVFGIHAKTETEPVCYARNENTKELSKNLSAAIQTNWQNTYMSEKMDATFAEYLISSAAFMRESWEERDELHDSYTDCVNPYYMFWEGGNDPTHQDIRMIGCLHDITVEEAYFRFARPEYGLTIEDINEIFHVGDTQASVNRGTSQQHNDINSFDNLSFYRASDLGLLRVIEVWREEVKPRYQCFDPLATDQIDKFFRCEKEDLPAVRDINLQRKELYDQQGVPQEQRAYITAREIVDKYWQFYYMAPDGRILCEGETPYDHRSHPFTLSLFPYVNGEIHSFMGAFKDQQKFINRMVMINDYAIRSAAKGMTFLPLSLKPDDMSIEEYARQKSKFDAVFVYDDRKSRTGAKPEFYTHSAFNTGANEMLQTQLNMIHEVSGVSGALQGKTPQSGTSAARYALEAQNATTTIYPLIKKFNGFEERVATKKLITLQQFYEEGRDITPKKSEHQIFYKANACRNIKSSVSIKNAAASAAFAQMGQEVLDMLFNAKAIDARTYIKNLDAPFADKILSDMDQYEQQMMQGQMPGAPVQVPGADQQQAALATQLLQGPGELFINGQPATPSIPQ